MRRLTHPDICRNEHGMTLVELMIVVAIVGICASLAGPAYKSWAAQNELKTAALTGQSTLALAKMHARQRSTVTTVRWAVSERLVTTTIVDAAGVPIRPATPFGSHVTHVQVSDSAGAMAPSGTVSFTPLGLRAGGPVGRTQVVTLTNSLGQTSTITITPGGRISWCPNATCV